MNISIWHFDQEKFFGQNATKSLLSRKCTSKRPLKLSQDSGAYKFAKSISKASQTSESLTKTWELCCSLTHKLMDSVTWCENINGKAMAGSHLRLPRPVGIKSWNHRCHSESCLSFSVSIYRTSTYIILASTHHMSINLNEVKVPICESISGHAAPRSSGTLALPSFGPQFFSKCLGMF